MVEGRQPDHLEGLMSKESATMKAAIAVYEKFHEARFDYVVAQVKAYCPDRSAHVLDVGRSYLTLRLLAYYETITTIGFPLERESFTGIDRPGAPRRWIAGHIAYDLNEAQTLQPIDTAERFDLIVFAEVLEHLHTAPELTIFALKSLMKPGGLMIVQTPNAAALHKRLLLLFGYNPYEKIRVDTGNPGHFREYTKAELIAYARDLDLEVVAHEYKDYFGTTGGSRVLFAIYKAIVWLLPVLSRGQTIVLRKRLEEGR